MDGFLDKLAGRRRLLQEIARLVGGDETRDRPTFLASQLLERLRGDRAGLEALSREFAATTDAAAAECRAALGARDWIALEREIHRVRGAAAFLEAASLLAALDRLSSAATSRDAVAAAADLASVEAEVDAVRREMAAELPGHTTAEPGR